MTSPQAKTIQSRRVCACTHVLLRHPIDTCVQARTLLYFDEPCLGALHSPSPNIFNPVLSTMTSIAPVRLAADKGISSFAARLASDVKSGIGIPTCISRAIERPEPSDCRYGKRNSSRSASKHAITTSL